ncbi:MAG: hypothetical protein AAF772_03860 [Acidobacteriota bacterium]
MATLLARGRNAARRWAEIASRSGYGLDTINSDMAMVNDSGRHADGTVERPVDADGIVVDFPIGCKGTTGRRIDRRGSGCVGVF